MVVKNHFAVQEKQKVKAYRELRNASPTSRATHFAVMILYINMISISGTRKHIESAFSSVKHRPINLQQVIGFLELSVFYGSNRCNKTIMDIHSVVASSLAKQSEALLIQI